MEKSSIKCPSCDGDDPDCSNCGGDDLPETGKEDSSLNKNTSVVKAVNDVFKALKAVSVNSIGRQGRLAQAVKEFNENLKQQATQAAQAELQPALVYHQGTSDSPCVIVHKSQLVSAHSPAPEEKYQDCKSCGYMFKAASCDRCDSIKRGC